MNPEIQDFFDIISEQIGRERAIVTLKQGSNDLMDDLKTPMSTELDRKSLDRIDECVKYDKRGFLLKCITRALKKSHKHFSGIDCEKRVKIIHRVKAQIERGIYDGFRIDPGSHLRP